MADVLLMATPAPALPDREIQVRIRDGDGALLRGSVISWTEDDDPRGTIDPSDGHTTLYPLSRQSIVRVTVDYEREVQSRKLAIDQTLCEFDYPEVHLKPVVAIPAPLPAAASAPAPLPIPAADPVKPPAWSNSTVLAAAVTAIGVAFVGYLQFGPATHDKDKVTLTIYVKDAVSAAAVPRARVTVQSSSVPAPALSDSHGVAIFELPSGKGESLTITGSATNYEDGTVVTKASDRPVDLLLKAKATVLAPPPPASGPRPSAMPALTGAWEVRVKGNIVLKSVRSGSFDFSALPDGRTVVRAQVDIDGATMRLSGFASRQNDRLFLTYSAHQGADSWEGQGQLNLANGEMQGYLTDLKGQQLPITLRKP